MWNVSEPEGDWDGAGGSVEIQVSEHERTRNVCIATEKAFTEGTWLALDYLILSNIVNLNVYHTTWHTLFCVIKKFSFNEECGRWSELFVAVSDWFVDFSRKRSLIPATTRWRKQRAARALARQGHHQLRQQRASNRRQRVSFPRRWTRPERPSRRRKLCRTGKSQTASANWSRCHEPTTERTQNSVEFNRDSMTAVWPKTLLDVKLVESYRCLTCSDRVYIHHSFTPTAIFKTPFFWVRWSCGYEQLPSATSCLLKYFPSGVYVCGSSCPRSIRSCYTAAFQQCWGQ